MLSANEALYTQYKIYNESHVYGAIESKTYIHHCLTLGFLHISYDITDNMADQQGQITTMKHCSFFLPIRERFKGIAGSWRFSGLLGLNNPCLIAG